MNTKKYILKGTVIILLLSIVFSSCKKFMDVGTPKVELASGLVFGDDLTATNAMVGIYGEMMSSQNFFSLYSSSYLGQYADELIAYGTPASKYYYNSLDASTNDVWSTGYKYVYRANAIIEGVSKSDKIADSTKTVLTGEARFIRAFSHFYLVNLFGDIPYIKTTAYAENNLAVRQPVSEVYNEIIADLLAARTLVKSYYPDAKNKPYASILATERVRPNKAVVTAMLARVYLYMGNWAKAEEEASTLISNSVMYSLPSDLNAVFLKNSTETIWQLQPSSLAFTNGYLGNTYILSSNQGPGLTRPTLSNYVWNAFIPGDQRQTKWVGTYTSTSGASTGTIYHYANKYRITQTAQPSTEYYMVFRLAEQYLIRAEARTKLHNVAGAVSDLNKLLPRTRATGSIIPKDYLSSIDENACMDAILHERQVELFTEWGHRWLDLKRMGKADEVLKVVKGQDWQLTDLLFPLPQDQLKFDPNMADQQNPGYNL